MSQVVLDSNILASSVRTFVVSPRVPNVWSSATAPRLENAGRRRETRIDGRGQKIGSTDSTAFRRRTSRRRHEVQIRKERGVSRGHSGDLWLHVILDLKRV